MIPYQGIRNNAVPVNFGTLLLSTKFYCSVICLFRVFLIAPKSLSSDSNLNRILYPGATEPRPLKRSWQSEALYLPEFWKSQKPALVLD